MDTLSDPLTGGVQHWFWKPPRYHNATDIKVTASYVHYIQQQKSQKSSLPIYIYIHKMLQIKTFNTITVHGSLEDPLGGNQNGQ